MTPGRFKIQPDPPIAGQPAQVTYEGSSRTIEYQVDDGPRVKVTIPPDTFPIDPVPGGDVLVLVDGTGDPAGGATVLIDHVTRSRHHTP